MVTVLLEYQDHNKFGDCSIRVYWSLLIFLAKHFLLCWQLCLMLLGTYYAQNYARIIGGCLVSCPPSYGES